MLKKHINIGLFLLIWLISPLSLANESATPAADPGNAPMATQLHHPEEFLQSIQNDPQAGKKIYQQFCSTCHNKNPSIDVGAPRIGVASDWDARMKKGLPGLLAVTATGVNQMPPRGGCFECSDAQLQAAIVYMLPKSSKNK